MVAPATGAEAASGARPAATVAVWAAAGSLSRTIRPAMVQPPFALTTTLDTAAGCSSFLEGAFTLSAIGFAGAVAIAFGAGLSTTGSGPLAASSRAASGASGRRRKRRSPPTRTKLATKAAAILALSDIEAPPGAIDTPVERLPGPEAIIGEGASMSGMKPRWGQCGGSITHVRKPPPPPAIFRAAVRIQEALPIPGRLRENPSVSSESPWLIL